jgi:hypothetical protein
VRESRRALKKLIEAAAKQERHALVQQNPFFPDLLNQPDVVSVPELGRLVAIYLHAPTQPVSWRTVLPAIEDLFELKTSVHQASVAIVVQDFTHGVSQTSTNSLELLGEMFDLLLPVNDDLDHERLTSGLRRAIRQLPPKDRFFGLWAAEKERISKQLVWFSEERYRSFVEEGPPSVRKREELISSMANDATDQGLHPLREALVRTPKEAIGGLPERSRFSFDLTFWDRQDRQVLIDAISFGRYGPRPHLRYLMTKARFTSYEPVSDEPGEPFRLIQRHGPLRRVLLVDGSLAGPKHDPYRYVRALVSVGWEIERADREVLSRLVNANVQEGN